jgi:hypothetical protein
VLCLVQWLHEGEANEVRFSSTKAGRMKYGARRAFLKPCVEDGCSERTLEEYLKEDPTRRQYLKPFGASARGRPGLLDAGAQYQVAPVPALCHACITACCTHCTCN